MFSLLVFEQTEHHQEKDEYSVNDLGILTLLSKEVATVLVSKSSSKMTSNFRIIFGGIVDYVMRFKDNTCVIV